MRKHHRQDDWTDYFCGSGGSSTGLTAIKGATVRVAANHWKLAVETHGVNHPTTDHLCADISQYDPRRLPRTRFAWFSPSCTNHSGAKGKKRDYQGDLFEEYVPDEAADRSRATMWDVPRFSEFHGYDYVIVENVVEAALWNQWPAWLMAMECEGYTYRVVYLNSMHATNGGPGAPQSRDRMYVVFWKKGLPAPDFAKWTRPMAYCPSCDEHVRAVQAWKNPEKMWGRYNRQYVWRCPNFKCRNEQVYPAVSPAASVIDFTLPGQRIGDRDKPLSDKTMTRIEHGLGRAWESMLVPVEGRDGKAPASTADPMRTLTTRAETGLAMVPFIAELRGGGSTSRPVTDPLATFTASGFHHGLTIPPGFLMRQNGTTSNLAWASTPFDEPMRTLTTKGQQAVVTMPWAGIYGYDSGQVRSTAEVLPTQTTVDGDALLHGVAPLTERPAVEDCLFRMLVTREIKGGMAFPDEYVILGNKREQAKLLGNAVTPPNSRDLGAMVMEAANGSPVEFETAA